MTKPFLRAAALPLAALLALAAVDTGAEGVPEQIASIRLPVEPREHWVWVNDVSFERIEAGRAALVDGDSGDYLGWLTTGVFFMALSIPSDYSALYSVETYYSRGVRGERSDVVSVYDPASLLPVDEIALPPKRGTGASTRMHASITDDDRFLLVYNFTPAQSVSVVDLRARRFVGEIGTAGCVLVYPDGPRRFHMLCGNGDLLIVDLDDAGRAAGTARFRTFFDPLTDPIQEDAVRIGDQWLYVSYGGQLYGINAATTPPSAAGPWSLLSEEDRRQNWRTGGAQLIAGNESSRLLYVLVHQGDQHSQEDAGTEVWVYELGENRRVQRIQLRAPASSIEVSQDDRPLLFAASTGATDLEIYDATIGEYLRTIRNVAAFPTVLQAPWQSQ